MKTKAHNYERFQGWRLLALLIVFMTYTVWFTVFGPFGDLEQIAGYENLQSRGFYTGAEAVAAVESLSVEGRAIKHKALGFDLIYMVLQMWVFEAVLAFGLIALGWMNTRWRWLLLAPMGFLCFDFLEDSFIALVMATSSEVIGGFAGVFTLMKFVFFIPLVFLSLGFGIAGIITTALRKRKASEGFD